MTEPLPRVVEVALPEVRLSVAVMAHPSRAEQVETLLERLDRPAEVVWDRIGNRWDTGRRSQLAYDPAATHHLVIQDDAIPCRDLCAGLEQAIAWAPPGVAFSTYIGRVRPYAARVARTTRLAENAAWIVMSDLLWGVGVVLPTGIIEQVIRDQDRKVSILEYDRRLSRWLATRHVPVWYTWPSLVDHRDGPSLVNHGEGRHAFRFVGQDRSALEVDWSAPAVTMPNPRGNGLVQFPRRLDRPGQPVRRPVVVRR